MTEKVKIPQKVADAIEKIREAHTNFGLVQLLENGRLINPELLDSVGVLRIWTHEEEDDGRNADKLLEALVNGYEVEPKIKVGDWVANLNGGTFYPKGNIKAVEVLSVEIGRTGTTCVMHGENGAWGTPVSLLRHATPEEVTEEKERRKWANIGRVDGEFRDGDIALDKFGRILHTIEEMEAAYQMGDLSGFHPAGSYISFEEGDEK